MQIFVYWTGVYNLIIGSVFLNPGSTNIFGIQTLEAVLWLRLPSILVFFLGILLIYIMGQPRAPHVPAQNLLLDR